MYTEIKGNIFNTTVKYIMHQVNAQGVMGAGIAKAIKDDISYKDFMEYREFCRIHNKNALGAVLIIDSVSNPNRHYLNVIGQQYYGRNPNIVYTDYNALKTAFLQIAESLPEGTGIAIPYRMGAGLANGDWQVIKNLIQTYLNKLNVFVYRL